MTVSTTYKAFTRLTAVLIASLCFFQISAFAEDSVPKIKGLYLGMNGDEALKIVSGLNEGKEIKKNVKGHWEYKSFLYANEGDKPWDSPQPNIVLSDLSDSGTVVEISFSGSKCDELFGTRELDSAEFARKVAESYSIPSLKAVDSSVNNPFVQNGVDYVYASPDGWKIIVDSRHGITMKFTAKQKAMD